MKKCDWCHTAIIAGGVKRGELLFCSANCERLSRMPAQFCARCMADTTDDVPGRLFRLNGCGTTLLKTWGATPRPTCQSVVYRKWVTMAWIPHFPLSKYRVIWRVQRSMPIGTSRFLARKVKG